jgi:hypothetical protein
MITDRTTANRESCPNSLAVRAEEGISFEEGFDISDAPYDLAKLENSIADTLY